MNNEFWEALDGCKETRQLFVSNALFRKRVLDSEFVAPPLHGIIRDPGKFESEMWYVPLLYEQLLDGALDELYANSDDGWGSWETVVKVDPWLRIEYGMLAGTVAVALCGNESGFVSAEELDADQLHEEYEITLVLPKRRFVPTDNMDKVFDFSAFDLESRPDPYEYIFTNWRKFLLPHTDYHGLGEPHYLRPDLVRAFSWAVPNWKALDAIERHSPSGVIEIGAGTGYWAHRLALNDVRVMAFDIKPFENGQAANAWFNVVQGGPEKAALHPDKTLFLSWPPYAESMASDALQAYTGNTVIYIGEGWGGCTADDEFHDALNTYWKRVELVELPQYNGIHDSLFIFIRRGEDGV